MRLPFYEASHRDTVSRLVEAQLLVIHLNGGWGNQFHTLMGSLPLAVALNRTLVLNFPWPDVIAAALEPNMVDWRPWKSHVFVKPPLTTVLNAASVSDAELIACQSINVLHVGKGGIGVSGYNHYRRWSPALRGRAQAQGLYPQGARGPDAVFEYLFRRTPALNAKIQELHSALSPHGQPYLAMHVRTGVEELEEMIKANWTHFVDETSAMEIMPKLALRAMHMYALPPQTKWMLATDNVEFAMRMHARWPDNVFVTNKDLPLLHGGLHINRGGGVEGSILTFADWFLMTQAAVVLRAGPSSYSLTAVYYTNSRCEALDGNLLSANNGAKLYVNVCPNPPITRILFNTH